MQWRPRPRDRFKNYLLINGDRGSWPSKYRPFPARKGVGRSGPILAASLGAAFTATDKPSKRRCIRSLVEERALADRNYPCV